MIVIAVDLTGTQQPAEIYARLAFYASSKAAAMLTGPLYYAGKPRLPKNKLEDPRPVLWLDGGNDATELTSRSDKARGGRFLRFCGGIRPGCL
jgi:hypothetical protein